MGKRIVVNAGLIETRLAVQDRESPDRAVRGARRPPLHRRQHLQGRGHQRPARHAGRLREHRAPKDAFLYVGDYTANLGEDERDLGSRRGRGRVRRGGGGAGAGGAPANGAAHRGRCCTRARRSWCRCPRNRWGPRARASPPSSPCPAAPSSTCRRRATSACRAASTTSRSASASARSSRASARRAAASSCARWPRARARKIWLPTSSS